MKAAIVLPFIVIAWTGAVLANDSFNAPKEAREFLKVVESMDLDTVKTPVEFMDRAVNNPEFKEFIKMIEKHKKQGDKSWKICFDSES
ncbi:MAG: hypothetical protein OEY33_04555 [Bdellovibrionales bacterium]|nr:hypothetical protein [Bdellovibrionales bacterium]